MQPADDATVARSPEETPTVVVSATLPVDAPHHRQLTPGAIIGGRYRIVSMLGRGGMGEVYRADDLRMGQPVALKFLSARLASERGRLYDEVRMGRQIAHPNVCRVYDVSEIDGDAFITMEFVDGEDLASLIRRIGRLSATKAISLAREITSGLAAAHEKGVVHRDLKPANVMVDDRGRARITDFGLAVAEDGVQARSLAGTPAYMAPEQLDGQPATSRSDIYALGLVLYEIFTGRRAFAAESITQLVEAQRTSRYTRPATLAPDLPPDVEQLIVRCLDFDATKRPSADALLRELPTFDALAAAVAAGETPAPDVVAGADDRDALSVPFAWALLLFVLAGLAACVLLSRSTMLYARQTKMRSPEVLADRAREIVQTLSAAPVADSAFGYIAPGGAFFFRYRQSPAAMRSRAAGFDVLTGEPPLTVPGMATVTLDGDGALRSVAIVPPAREQAPKAARADFASLLARSRLTELVPVPPEYKAPVDTDEKHAWQTRDGTRVETAAYHGVPVWFSVIAPSRVPVKVRQLVSSMEALRIATLLSFLLGLSVAAVLLARRNLRRGTGDTRSAFRLAAFVFVTMTLGMIAHAHHPPAVTDELGTLAQLIVDNAFVAAVAGLAYIAVEPLVRRYRPRALIGSTRVLAGTWRDRVVGRDLLAGACGGVVFMLIMHASALTPGASPLHFAVSPFGEVSNAFYLFFYQLADGVIRSLAVVTLLVAVRALVRNNRVAIVIATFLLAVGFVSDFSGTVAVRATFALAGAALVTAVLFRFGVLALSVAAYFATVLRMMPVTLDPSTWYFARSIASVAVLAAITIAGFIFALGDRASLRLALDD